MRRVLTAITPPFILDFFKSVYYFLLRERVYEIEGCPVLLPRDHRLDLFQKRLETYDRFLPLLAHHIDKQSVVIDVGANVGDSAIPFLKKGITTICLEPSTYFFSYLERNVKQNNFQDKAILIRKFVSNNPVKTNLFIKNGTATSIATVKESNSIEDVESFVTLDEILESNGEKNISLVKIDTDGFDHDVIMSGLIGLRKRKPILFFENLVNAENQGGYLSAYKELESIGYSGIAVFDNFGNMILGKASWDDVGSLNRYCLRRNGVPFQYTDILCYTPESKVVVSGVIEQFLKTYKH